MYAHKRKDLRSLLEELFSSVKTYSMLSHPKHWVPLQKSAQSMMCSKQPSWKGKWTQRPGTHGACLPKGCHVWPPTLPCCLYPLSTCLPAAVKWAGTFCQQRLQHEKIKTHSKRKIEETAKHIKPCLGQQNINWGGGGRNRSCCLCRKQQMLPGPHALPLLQQACLGSGSKPYK